eukprot:7587468-Pyramimonas_sp.AAC.1
MLPQLLSGGTIQVESKAEDQSSQYRGREMLQRPETAERRCPCALNASLTSTLTTRENLDEKKAVPKLEDPGRRCPFHTVSIPVWVHEVAFSGGGP